MSTWQMLHPAMTLAHLGLLPMMLNARDPRPAREQFHSNYAHGGGWCPITGFRLMHDHTLAYPGDPPLTPRAQLQFRNELIVFYDYAWVAIIQPDRSFEVSRMD
jgi:hypothetical protein